MLALCLSSKAQFDQGADLRYHLSLKPENQTNSQTEFDNSADRLQTRVLWKAWFEANNQLGPQFDLSTKYN